MEGKAGNKQEPYNNKRAKWKDKDARSSSSSSSTSSDSIAIIDRQTPPDGGYGWVVVGAAFLVNLIADGITFSFGVMFTEFEYKHAGKSNTAWIGSVFMAMPLLSGPLASFLTDRYGCRRVTIAGSLLSAGGFALSTLTDSLVLLLLTFGVMAGFGLSLCYVAAVVIVAYYFEEKRSFATGLSQCGSGIGTFIFAPFTQHLLQAYGLKATTLIYAGFFLILAICGALMRSVEWRTESIKKKKSKENCENNAEELEKEQEELHKLLETEDANRLCSSLVALPTFLKNGDKVPEEALQRLSNNKKSVYEVLKQNYPGLISPSLSDCGGPTKLEGDHPAHNNTALHSNKNRGLHTAFLRDLKVHRHSLTYRGAMLNINRYRLRASSCPNIYRNSMTTIREEKEWYSGLSELKSVLLDMLDFSYFKSIRFALFAASNFLLYVWYDVPYVYLTDYARELGFEESPSTYLISFIGAFNMLGEVLLGWIGDKKWANSGILYALSMIICGVATSAIPLFSKNYAALGVYASIFGFFIAANYSLTSIILVELITIERFTNAYGLLLLVQGIGNLIGPPLAGWLCDITGTYNLSFYLAGFFIVICGILLIILPCTEHANKQRKQSNNSSSSSTIKTEVINGNGTVITISNKSAEDLNENTTANV